MSKKTWRVVDTRPGYDLKLFASRFDIMENPRNGAIEPMIILESRDAANVVALTGDQEIILVRQFRFGTKTETLELPGGLIEGGEAVMPAAQRELQEETGYTSEQWSVLGKIASNPVFLDSYIHHLLALDVQLTHQPRLDPGEDIEVVLYPVPEVRRMLKQGTFEHPHTISGLVAFFFRDGIFQ